MSSTGTSFLKGRPAGVSFTLTDHHGRSVTETDYRSRYMLLFFGFTHCRSVCPRALTRISNSLAALGEQANDIQPLYVTVDPERDSSEVMKTFLETRFPRFTGLTGTREQIDSAKSMFRVFAERAADPENSTGYAMPHSALTYLIGPDGTFITHFPDTVDQDGLTQRLKKLVA